MNKLYMLLFLAATAIMQMRADKVEVIDLFTMSPTQKDVSMTPNFSVEENGDTINVHLNFSNVSEIKGDEGYGWSKKSNANNSEFQFVEKHEFIDVWTKERFSELPDVENYKFNVEQKDNGIIEITIRMVEAIEDDDRQPGRVEWNIVGSYKGGGAKGFYPLGGLPHLRFNRYRDNRYNEFKLISTDYVDFENVDNVFPYGVAGDCFTCVAPIIDDIIPGFSPKSFEISVWDYPFGSETAEDHEPCVYLDVDPLQYDIQNRVMRVHRKIIVQRNLPPAEESGVSELFEEETESAYFTIDGLPVKNPQKGKLYIRRSGNEFTKIVF